MRLQQGFVTDGMGFRVKLHSSNFEPLMSALGQKQTLQQVRAMSALPPKADIGTQPRNVRFVPKADIQLIVDMIVLGKVLNLVGHHRGTSP